MSVVGLSLRMPVRFFRGRVGRLALAVGGIATCVCAVCGNLLISRAVLEAFTDVVDAAAGRADLQVSLDNGGVFSKDVAITVARVPGVGRVVPVLSATAFTTDGTDELVEVHGFDLVDSAAARFYDVEIRARRPHRRTALSSPGLTILTEPFARRHGLVVGNRFDLDTPRGRKTFTVARLIPADGLARLYEGNVVIMDLYAAQLAFAQRAQINRVDVAIRQGHDVERVAEAVRAVLPVAMHVESPSHRRSVLKRTVQPLAKIVDLVTVGVFLAGFLIAFGSLSALFEERAWEISVLRAVGLRRAAVWHHLLLEGLSLGVLGVLAGIPLGVAYAGGTIPKIATAAAISSDLVMPEAHLRVYLPALVIAAMLGLTTTLVAAALPAWRASRVQIVDTLRNRGIEQEGIDTRWRRLFGVVACSLAVLAIVLEIQLRSGLWGLIAGSLLVLVTALLSRPLVDVFVSRLAGVMTDPAGPSARLAVAGIARCPRRSSLVVAVIGVGIGSVFWLWMLAVSYEQSVFELVKRGTRADLIVSSSHIGSGFTAAPVDDAFIERLRAVPGVAATAASRNVQVRFDGDMIAIQAADPEFFVDDRFSQWPLSGPRLKNVWEAVAHGQAVVASTNFVQNLERSVGDSVKLETPTGSLILPIAGVTTHFLSTRGTLMMSRDVYARAWHDNRVNDVLVRVTENADIGTVRDAIRQGLAREYTLRITSAHELAEHWGSQVRRAFAGVYVLAGVTLLIVALGTMATLVAETVARTRELGALRVVGLRRGHVRRMLLIQALALGILGLFIGTATGFAHGMLWVEATFPYLYGLVIDLHVPYAAAGGMVVLTLVVCLAAGLAPAERAARLQPAVAVRDE